MSKHFAGSAAAAKDWIGRFGAAVLDDPASGVIALGIGKKSTGPINDDSAYCVTSFVERKLSQRELKSRSIVDFRACFKAVSGAQPADLALETDVVETGSAFSASPGLRLDRAARGRFGGRAPSIDLQKRFEAVRAGIGITNPVGSFPEFLSVGTLGFFARDGEGRVYLVSNNHVIANENDARAGNAVVQPGTLDLTDTELDLMNTLDKLRSRLQIAKLSAWVPIEFRQGTTVPLNEVDCAIAEILPNKRDLSDIARVGLGGVVRGLGPNYRIDPATGQLTGSTRVYKAGRTTGATEGDVVAFNVLSDVEYGAGVARFGNQIAIRAGADNTGPFSDAGDSGSGILNRQHQLVALLFAGSDTRTLANPIRPVLARLGTALGHGKLSVITR